MGVWQHQAVTWRRRAEIPGGWRIGEVWLDTEEIEWFGELKRTVQEAFQLPPLLVPEAAVPVLSPAPASASALPLPRPRVVTRRRRRVATRLVPTLAAVSAVGLGIPLVLDAQSGPLQGELLVASLVAPALSDGIVVPHLELQPAAPPAVTVPKADKEPPAAPVIHWRDSTAVGLPHVGRLVDGVALPREGPGWVTWDPALDRIPNRPNRLYGTDVLVRKLLAVLESYRRDHPNAPPLLVGDLSLRGGGEIDEHASHENGRDVDVYYPRLDGRLLPPSHPGQVDLRLAQDLLDRFVAAGAQMIFVGQSVGLRGPAGVVVPYPNHDNHMHVRIPPVL